jgi:glycine hydroxymethyltransferase
MAIYDRAPAGALRLDRANQFPTETHAADGKLLGWLAGIFAQDRHYHTVMATLTASENYPSAAVRAASAFLGGGHYFFDAPSPGHCGEWSFPRSGTLPAIQTKFLAQMKRLFAAEIADWRPNGGSMCEQAVVMATCSAGDAFVELAPEDGGHFGAAVLAERLAINSFTFPMAGDLIDVEATLDLVRQHPSIRLLLVQPSHCRRPQPIDELASALPEHVTLAVDISHTAGLIAGGLLPQPLLQGADILTFNTHKTVPGPNKGVIAFADRNHPLAHTMWETVCPQLQSNSHPECLPGLVIALEEIATFGRAYAEQVIANARTLAHVLDSNGISVEGMEYGGTQTHQVHVRLGTADVANKIANEVLPTCGIRTNSVFIPGTGGAFGLRLGSQALTRRGLTEVDFAKLGRLLARALRWNADAGRIRSEVAELLAKRPLFPLHFSFDHPAYEPHVERLLTEVLGEIRGPGWSSGETDRAARSS